MSNNHRSSKLTHQVYARTARPVASSLSDLIQTACLFSEKNSNPLPMELRLLRPDCR